MSKRTKTPRPDDPTGPTDEPGGPPRRLADSTDRHQQATCGPLSSSSAAELSIELLDGLDAEGMAPSSGTQSSLRLPLGGGIGDGGSSATGDTEAESGLTSSLPAGNGRYQILRELGRGGMGVVYEARDTQLDRLVAIKSLSVRPERRAQLQRFFREARIASRLNHPGIMAVHEFGIDAGGQASMVMRRLHGETLREILASRSDPIAELPQMLAVFLQVCQAVASAHADGVIHRDLKPANIMVGAHGQVTVMDWGLAKVLSEADGIDDTLDDTLAVAQEQQGEPAVAGLVDLHTVCGTVFGTPAYLAPEQARGDNGCVDRRADVFGLGSILCEILTGSPPYRDPVPASVWQQATVGDTSHALQRLATCAGPAPIVALACRCLAVDPNERPADAAELAASIVAYIESGQRRAERQLVRFFDLSVDLFCIASLSGYFLRVNDNFPRLLGYSERELVTRKFLEFVHPDDQEMTVNEVTGLSQGETTIQFRNRYRRSDGTYRWLEWNARAVAEEEVIYAVARDVTERTELEAALEKSRRELTDFTENVNVPLHWVDGNGIIIWANKAELDLLGYRRDEYVGRPIASFHADRPVIEDILTRLSSGQCLSGYEARLITRDGSIRYVSIHSSVYSEGGQFRHTRCFSVDVTGQHRGPRLAALDAEVARLRDDRDALRGRVVQLERVLAGKRGDALPGARGAAGDQP